MRQVPVFLEEVCMYVCLCLPLSECRTVHVRGYFKTHKAMKLD